MGNEIKRAMEGTLKAVYFGDRWVVEDESGQIWDPNPDAAREIEASEDPETTTLEMCEQTPHRGVWYC